MTYIEYTPEQIDAAWETADVIEGYDPSETRIVWWDDSGSIIHRAELQSESLYGWLIDDEGRARGRGYESREMLAEERNQVLREVTGEKTDEAFKQAVEAGIPQAFTLFLRVKDLEDMVMKQAEEIQELKQMLNK